MLARTLPQKLSSLFRFGALHGYDAVLKTDDDVYLNWRRYAVDFCVSHNLNSLLADFELLDSRFIERFLL